MTDSKDKPIAPKGSASDPAPASAGEVAAFLAKMKSVPATAKGRRGRLLFIMDATMSRQPTWDRALHIQADMFKATSEIGGLDVQLAWFRGFGEFKASAWVSDTNALANAMTGVRCRGGHTQIERSLRHALRESGREPGRESGNAPVDAVVLVGDCLEESIDDVCAVAGELGLRGVPVFAFQEGHDATAAQAFREIARLTRGAYCRFDLGSAQQLRDLLSAVAVYASGGRQALEDFSKARGGDVKLLAHQVR